MAPKPSPARGPMAAIVTPTSGPPIGVEVPGRWLNGFAELAQGLKNFGHVQALLAFLRFSAPISRLTGCCASWGCSLPL